MTPLRFGLLATAIGLALPTVLAAYPERPVTILVPFAPGGANDVVVRAIQQPLADALGQPIVVENRGGAGGSLGTAHAARQKPDGYTILMAATGYVVNPSLYDKVHYDPLKDFEPIAEVTTFPVIYAVRPDIGVKSMQELIAYAKTARRRAQLFDARRGHPAPSRGRTAQTQRRHRDGAHSVSGRGAGGASAA